jgi:hypothetical protein
MQKNIVVSAGNGGARNVAGTPPGLFFCETGIPGLEKGLGSIGCRSTNCLKSNPFPSSGPEIQLVCGLPQRKNDHAALCHHRRPHGKKDLADAEKSRRPDGDAAMILERQCLQDDWMTSSLPAQQSGYLNRSQTAPDCNARGGSVTAL